MDLEGSSGQESPQKPAAPLEGFYSALGPNGEVLNLSITLTGSVYVASLQFDKPNFNIGLPYAQVNLIDHSWYFTSGEISTVGRWFQLRGGLMADGTWKAQFLIGGKGIKFKEIYFNKL